AILWETFKAVIRGNIISYSAHVAKLRKQKQSDLLNSVLETDKKYAVSPSPELYAERLKLQSQFNLISTGKAEYLLRRTKGFYYEYDDKASRLLAHQLKRQSPSNFIFEISSPSGSLTSEPSKINSVFTSFYSKLYQSEPPVDNSVMSGFLDALSFPVIDPHLKRELDSPLCLDEIFGALKKNEKW
ncbi:hypothetical protein LDENG_00195530, partial [Lucifuga dentata]